MGQLAQKIAERPTRTFGANTEKNPKEECKAVVTKSQKQEGKETDKVLQHASTEEEEDADEEENNDKVSAPKTKSQLAWEARREMPPVVLKEAPYPLVPSKKEQECELAIRFVSQ